MEHPAEPRKDERPSIWRLPWLRAMLSSGDLQKCLILQAHYGGVSVKPTNLVFCHMPHFLECLRVHRQPFDRNKLITLSGKDQTGKWQTSYAKEYPAGLNNVLALAFVQAQTVHQQPDPAPLPEAVRCDYESLNHGNDSWEEQVMRPDFGGHFRALDSLD